MDLYSQMILEIISSEIAEKIMPRLEIDINKIIEMKCYQALSTIKTIIEDDSLDDKECFLKIEQIITTFEEIGSDAGGRHDY